MKGTPTLLTRVNLAAWMMATASVAAACGGTSHAPLGTPSQEAARARDQEAPANTPTAATVVISEDIRRACGIPDTDAYFRFDSAHLTAKDKSPLDAVAQCFTRGPLAGKSVRLVGHSDPRGSADYNMTLGQSRADAVGVFLSSRGLSRERAATSSRGAMDATGTDEKTWAQDRRVDITLND